MTGGDNLTAHPELICNSPVVIQDELLQIIRDAIATHPRSLQKEVGPSSLGTPCIRNLLHMLHGDPEPADDPWLPTIGTAVHAWIAEAFETTPYNAGRYLIEHSVDVGQIAPGCTIRGHSDLFDTLAGCVIDWKIVGITTLRDVKKNGAKAGYRIQAHCYGLGFKRQGYRVNNVMIAFLPRNAISLDDALFWSEPYNEQIALDALERCAALVQLLAAVGIDQAVQMFPECGGVDFCKWCPPVKAEPKPIDPNADPLAATTRRKATK